MAESSFDDPGTPVVGAEAAMRTPPFVKVPAIVRAEDSAVGEADAQHDETAVDGDKDAEKAAKKASD